MKQSKVFSAEVTRKTKAKSFLFRYFFVDSKPELSIPIARTYVCKNLEDWTTLFTDSRGDSTWICAKTERADTLLRAASHTCRQWSLGDLVLLESPKAESLPPLQAIFRKVIGQVSACKMLPADELTEVLVSPEEERRDLFIGGSIDPTSESLTLTRGDLDTIVVPFSMFQPSGTDAPEFDRFAVTDYGNTIRLGEYEAAADAILYEADSAFRKRLNAKRRQDDKGFGASLRRLRAQKHFRRTDFGSVSAKTIARIERGETGKPHGATLNTIASVLGVSPLDIETY